MCSLAISIIHSIAAGEALIENVLHHYPIGTPLSCRLYQRGLNDTYLVETEQDRYILRVYRRGWRTKEEIDFELELLAFLHEQNMPVSYPIARKNGSFTEAILAPEGTRYAAVFSYAPGRAVNKKLDSQQSRRLGEVLASLHKTVDTFKSHFSRPALSSEYLLDCSMDFITTLCRDTAVPCPYPIPQAIENRYVDYFQTQIEKIKLALAQLKLSSSAPIYGICVGDVHSGNAHFTDKGEPTLFDFDQCGYGWRTFDIAKFIHTTFSWQMDSQVRKPFLEGYQAIRQLSEAELASIPVFAKMAHIWVMGITCQAAGEVVPYGHFTDEWFDSKLALLTQLNTGDLDI